MRPPRKKKVDEDDRGRNYFELAPAIILVLRRDETVEFINQKGCDLLGHPKDFIIGKNWFDFFIPPKTQAIDKYHYERAIDVQVLQESYENSIWTSGGHERMISWRSSFIRDSTGDIEALLSTGEDITENNLYKKFLQRRENRHSQEILSAAVDAQEKERNEIADELHGNVNQILTTCKLLLESEKANQPDSILLRHVKEYLQNAIDEIRNLSHHLDSTQVTDIGLVASIKGLLEKINIARRYELQFICEDETIVDGLDNSVALSVYRIIQEQLSNIIKHADASKIIISLKCSDTSADLTITDNGKGFDPKTIHKGLGLRNIYNRASIHKGIVLIHTSPKDGCTVSVSIPL